MLAGESDNGRIFRSAAVLGLVALLVGCSSFDAHVPGQYSGTLTRQDGAVFRHPGTRHTDGAGNTTAVVTRTSGSTTASDQKVQVVRVRDTSHPDGMALFHVTFGRGCSAAVVANAPKLEAQSETGNHCVCPVGGKDVKGSVMLDGSFDDHTKTLQWSAHVLLGGPDYGGGCTYTFKGRKIH